MSEESEDELGDWIDEAPNKPLQIDDWSCGSTFACGRQFLDMTYAKMYETVQELHISNAGIHLDVNARASDSKGGHMIPLPDAVHFYCPHAREHPDQCGKKKPATPTADRVSREEEEKRIFYSTDRPCQFRFVVRRDKSHVLPLEICEPKHGHRHYMKCEVKCDWFIDGLAIQILFVFLPCLLGECMTNKSYVLKKGCD